ncbi:MAG: segregation/condensation protein A, partial [Planctomycetota bacterium]
AAATPGAGYRVALDAYCGPLDLLLYLIRKNEVDINDIPIAHITEQYQRHIELMAEINVNIAGEFLIMAATLMEIKSRMLLPREEGIEEEEEDPRAELVRQLLEYKRYKDIARELGARAAEQALKFRRPGHAEPLTGASEEEAEEESQRSLEGIGLWELIDAFAKVLSETSIGPPPTQVVERERPIQEFRRELLELVESEKGTTFARVFANCKSRDEMIAMFIALLELVRLHRLRVQPVGHFGELHITLADGTPAPAAVQSAGPPPPEPEAAPAGRFKPVTEVDVLEELEEEAESLGRARQRIDAAIDGAEAFLKRHHEQARQAGPAEQDGPAGPPDGIGPPQESATPGPDGRSDAPPEQPRADTQEDAPSNA